MYYRGGVESTPPRHHQGWRVHINCILGAVNIYWGEGGDFSRVIIFSLTKIWKHILVYTISIPPPRDHSFRWEIMKIILWFHVLCSFSNYNYCSSLTHPGCPEIQWRNVIELFGRGTYLYYRVLWWLKCGGTRLTLHISSVTKQKVPHASYNLPLSSVRSLLGSVFANSLSTALDIQARNLLLQAVSDFLHFLFSIDLRTLPHSLTMFDDSKYILTLY